MSIILRDSFGQGQHRGRRAPAAARPNDHLAPSSGQREGDRGRGIGRIRASAGEHSPANPGATPRRTRRSRSCCRPRLSRLLTVPSGQPSCRAASSSERSSRSQSTIGRGSARAGDRARRGSSGGGRGRRADRAWRRRAPAGDRTIGARGCVAGPRPIGRTAATRWATPCSQGPTDSRLRIEPAWRSRTRNVAWKASSASCGSPRTPRQTRSTIGAVPLDQQGEGRLGLGVPVAAGAAEGRDPIQQLAVGQARQGSRVEDRLEVSPPRRVGRDGHDASRSWGWPRPDPCSVTRRWESSDFRESSRGPPFRRETFGRARGGVWRTAQHAKMFTAERLKS